MHHVPCTGVNDTWKPDSSTGLVLSSSDMETAWIQPNFNLFTALVQCIWGTTHLREGKIVATRPGGFPFIPCIWGARHHGKRAYFGCKIQSSPWCTGKSSPPSWQIMQFSIQLPHCMPLVFPLAVRRKTLVTKAWDECRLMPKMVSMNIRGC